jgi:hypothetical protein
MGEEWSDTFASSVRQWCEKMAILGADALIDAGLLAKADFEKAVAVLSEEQCVRLALRDYPPVVDSSGEANA